MRTIENVLIHANVSRGTGLCDPGGALHPCWPPATRRRSECMQNATLVILHIFYNAPQPSDLRSRTTDGLRQSRHWINFATVSPGRYARSDHFSSCAHRAAPRYRSVSRSMKVFSLGLAICAALAVTTTAVEAKGTICNTGSGFADTGDSYNSDKPTVPVSSSTGGDDTTQVEASSSTAGSDVTQVARSSSTGCDATQQAGSSSTTGDDTTQQTSSSTGSGPPQVAASSSTTGSDVTQVDSSSSTYSDDTTVTSASSPGSDATQNNGDSTTQSSDSTTTSPTKGSADGTTSESSDESDVGGSTSSNNDATSSKGEVDNTSSNSKGISTASSSSGNTVQDGSAPAANTGSQTGQQSSSVGGSKASTSSNAGQHSDVDSSQAASPTVIPASVSASGSSVNSPPTQSSTSSSSTDSIPTQSSTDASASSSSSTPIQSSKSGSSESSTPVQQTSTTASGSSDISIPVQQSSASASGSSAGSSPVQQTSASASSTSGSSTPVQQVSASGSSDTSTPVQQTSASGSDSSTPIQQTSTSASGSSAVPIASTSASGSSGSSTPTQGSTSASSDATSSSSASTSASAASTSASASASSSSSSSSFTKVTRLGVRVQGDMPEWNAEHQRFVSAYYETFDEKYRAVLDTVNMASVEGALKYVQAECINASVITDCERKNNIKYVVFYQTTTVQPTAAMDYYVNATDERKFAVESCPFMAMDGGQCDPNEDGSFPDVCNQYIGAGGQPELGFCVGGTLQDNEAIAPYPHNYWFSFPNSCPQQLWDDKTDSCRREYAGGMCEIGQEPDGVTCTFTYEILGYILLDDVVGITSMVNPATGNNYADYYEFCKAGGVEFSVSIVTGVLSLLTNVLSTVVDLVEGIEFWANPGDSDANAERVEKLVSAYDALVSANATTSDGGLMRALPTISELSALNPPCYENSPLCAESEFGCKRSYRSQICQVCTSDDSGCEKQ